MGNCQTTKGGRKRQHGSIKPTTYGSDLSNIFTTIKGQVEYFDKLNLKALNYPDLSIFIRTHIKNYKIVAEGKTWVMVNEIMNLLNARTTDILIRNYKSQTDAVLSLIFLLKELIKLARKVQEQSVLFDEQVVELYFYFQEQLVQISLEVLIATNTIYQNQMQWWSEEYFRWRKNYIQSNFNVQGDEKYAKGKQLELVQPIGNFIRLLSIVCNKLAGLSKASDADDFKIEAQQQCLQQFYSQMRVELFQTCQLSQSISQERKLNSQNISQNLKTHTLKAQIQH